MRTLFFTLSLFLFCLMSGQNKTLKMKDYKNIMNSKNIYEINAFLRDAHPDDPRRSILKPRVMEMMKDYINKAHPADQRIKEMQEMLATLKRRPSTKISFDEMNEMIRQKQIAHYKEEMEKANRRLAAANKGKASQSGGGQSVGGHSGKIAMANTGMAAGYENPEADEFQLLMDISPMEHKHKTAKILTSLFDNDPMSKESIVMVRNDSDCDIIMRMEGTGNNNFRLAIPAKKENSIVIPKGDYLFTSLVCGAQYASQKTIQKALMVALSNPGAL